jgi:hypothetical protein
MQFTKKAQAAAEMGLAEAGVSRKKTKIKTIMKNNEKQ